MFTDTKNLSNAAANNSSSNNNNHNMSLNSERKSKSKLRKALKPLLRLLSHKSASTTTTSATSSTSLSTKAGNTLMQPNNVNLNNVSSTLKEFCDLPSIEDYAAVIRKVAKDEHLQQYANALQAIAMRDEQNAHRQSATDTSTTHCSAPTVIRSASIEKSPLTHCGGCSHGRNCHHSHNEQLPVVVATEQEPSVHYIRTGSGNFYWSAAQTKLDDDLLNAWLCQSYHQQPTEVAVY